MVFFEVRKRASKIKTRNNDDHNNSNDDDDDDDDENEGKNDKH